MLTIVISIQISHHGIVSVSGPFSGTPLQWARLNGNEDSFRKAIVEAYGKLEIYGLGFDYIYIQYNATCL